MRNCALVGDWIGLLAHVKQGGGRSMIGWRRGATSPGFGSVPHPSPPEDENNYSLFVLFESGRYLLRTRVITFTVVG